MCCSHLHTEGDAEDVVERPVSRHGVKRGKGHPDRQAHHLRDGEREIHLSDPGKVKLRAIALGVLKKQTRKDRASDNARAIELVTRAGKGKIGTDQTLSCLLAHENRLYSIGQEIKGPSGSSW